jgi:hypothetical protein
MTESGQAQGRMAASFKEGEEAMVEWSTDGGRNTQRRVLPIEEAEALHCRLAFETPDVATYYTPNNVPKES